MMRTAALMLLALLIGSQDDAKKIEELIASLDDDKPQVREKAQAALINLGEKAVPRLKEAPSKASAEQKTRIEEILREIDWRVEEARTKGNCLVRPAAGQPRA